MTMPPPNVLTLTTLADGAAVEAFGAALEKLLANLDDPNTDWKAKRTIAIEAIFTSDEDRKLGTVQLRCTTKLPGQKVITSQVYYGHHHGVLTAVSVPSQIDMFPTPEARPRVVKEGDGA